MYNLSAITSCVFPCKLCANGNGFNNGTCLACYSSALSTNYLLWNSINNITSTGRCVSACPSSTYLNSSLSSCIDCPTSCLTCINDTYCNNCTANYYLYLRTCVTDCPDTYYPITANQTCNRCTQPCINCVNLTYCKSCISGYNLYLGNCITACPSGYIPQIVSNISICYQCASPCS